MWLLRTGDSGPGVDALGVRLVHRRQQDAVHADGRHDGGDGRGEEEHLRGPVTVQDRTRWKQSAIQTKQIRLLKGGRRRDS